MKVSLSFQIGKDTYKAEGKDVLACLKKIKPKSYMGMGKLQVIDGKKSSALPIAIVPLKMERIFTKPLEMEMFAKRIQTLL